MSTGANVRKVQVTPKGQVTITIPNGMADTLKLDKGQKLKFELAIGDDKADEKTLLVIKRV